MSAFKGTDLVLGKDSSAGFSSTSSKKILLVERNHFSRELTKKPFGVFQTCSIIQIGLVLNKIYFCVCYITLYLVCTQGMVSLA